jgi:hypothetical protein
MLLLKSRKTTSQIFAKPFALPPGWATLLEMFVLRYLDLMINNLKIVAWLGQIEGQMSALLLSFPLEDDPA